MKTAMQELIIAMNEHYSNPSRADVFDTSIYLEKEKKQIIEAVNYGLERFGDISEDYYNQTYS